MKADNVSHVPAQLTTEQAGVMACDALTALRGLDDMLGLKAGEALMIFGASGGIGHLAVQLAKRLAFACWRWRRATTAWRWLGGWAPTPW